MRKNDGPKGLSFFCVELLEMVGKLRKFPVLNGFKTLKNLDKATGNIYKCKSAFITEENSAMEKNLPGESLAIISYMKPGGNNDE